MKKIIIIAILFIPIFSFCQIETNELPMFFTNDINSNLVKNHNISEFDISKLILEDKNNSFYKQYSFAKSFDVFLDFEDSFSIETDSFIVQFLKISVPNAFGVALYFENFNLLEKEKLFIYNQSKTHLIGALSNINNKQSGFLHTRFIPDDTIIVEYHLLKANLSSNLKILSVAGAYRNLKDDSEWCEININCDSTELWQTVKKSVAKIVYKDDRNNSYYVCTGQLMANTSLDQTPYFLTANHCINTQTEANSAVFYFNYEAEDCLLTIGDENQTISGANLIATADEKLDFALLELSIVPPQSYDPYYVGWSRAEEYSDTSICIHHPAGDIKKISKNYFPLQIGTFSGYDYNKHWQVEAWNEGTTEGGSSGSGLFSTQGQLLGTLSGGDASCDNNYNDLYQQFYHQWDDYNSYSKQVSYWLDPFGFNPNQMYGYFPFQNIDLSKPINLVANLTDSVVELNWQATNPQADKYYIYKNLELIEETTEPVTLYDVLTEDNVYVYYVTAIFDYEESKPSNMVSIVYGDTSSIPKVTEIRLFPNPVSKQFTIIAPDTIPITKVEIYNYDGSKILEQIVDNERSIVIDIAGFAPSWYIVRIFTTGDIYIRKIIKVID